MTMFKMKHMGVIAAGLALFSMFFGAGDLIWPLILGGQAGNMNFYAMIGLLISGVSLPLLGLMSMMLFQGNYRDFFGQAGRIPSIILIFIIQAILGPLGSIPRLITLAHATLKPYLPEFINLAVFSVLACLLVFLFTLKRNRIVDIIGLVLSPILLVSLGAILVLGFQHPPAAQAVDWTTKQAFVNGLNVGYNTLDLIASFIFAPLVLSYFLVAGKEQEKANASDQKKELFKKMVKSCLIAGSLLAIMYVGLTYIASFYTPLLPEHAPEERLASVSLHLLGPIGAMFSCIAVSMSCLTTAIPISIISGEYIQDQFFKGKGSFYIATALSLVLSMIIANLGFMGIANMLSPVLQILCPGLIILSILNILHKLYEMRMRRIPIYAAFTISIVSYLVRL